MLMELLETSYCFLFEFPCLIFVKHLYVVIPIILAMTISTRNFYCIFRTILLILNLTLFLLSLFMPILWNLFPLAILRIYGELPLFELGITPILLICSVYRISLIKSRISLAYLTPVNVILWIALICHFPLSA